MYCADYFDGYALSYFEFLLQKKSKLENILNALTTGPCVHALPCLNTGNIFTAKANLISHFNWNILVMSLCLAGQNIPLSFDYDKIITEQNSL